MRSSRHKALAVPLVAVASSPLGHLLVYQARFGAAAAHEQSSGAHAYLPALAATLSAALGAALVASLLVIAVARLAAGRRRGLRPGRRGPFIDVLAAVFTLQVAAYAVQEAAEAVATGGTMPLIPELVLWGALGMLPVALLAAVGLTWLSVHLDAAVAGSGQCRSEPARIPQLRFHAPSAPRSPTRYGQCRSAPWQSAVHPDLLQLTLLVSIF